MAEQSLDQQGASDPPKSHGFNDFDDLTADPQQTSKEPLSHGFNDFDNLTADHQEKSDQPMSPGFHDFYEQPQDQQGTSDAPKSQGFHEFYEHTPDQQENNTDPKNQRYLRHFGTTTLADVMHSQYSSEPSFGPYKETATTSPTHHDHNNSLSTSNENDMILDPGFSHDRPDKPHRGPSSLPTDDSITPAIDSHSRPSPEPNTHELYNPNAIGYQGLAVLDGYDPCWLYKLNTYRRPELYVYSNMKFEQYFIEEVIQISDRLEIAYESVFLSFVSNGVATLTVCDFNSSPPAALSTPL